jgi:polyisoprenoid-binding protein YceI
MKYIIWIIVIVAVGFGVWKLIETKPEANIPQAQVGDDLEEQNENKEINNAQMTKTQVDNANVKVAFKGFGPGKVHDGSFGKVTSDLYFVGDALAGNITIDVDTLTTDTEKVTTHLKTKDFFDTAKFKTANFKISAWNNGTVTGVMTIRNIAKTISFPVTMANDAYTADFTLNMKEFGIDQKFANEEIELIVTVPVK